MNRALIAIVASGLFFGCTAYKHVAPVGRTFLEDVDTSKQLTNLPFQHSWVWARGIKRGDYRNIYIPPVRIDTLPPDAVTTSLSAFITSEDDLRAKAREIADYFREQLLLKIGEYSGGRLKVVSRPGPQTAVVKLAITELEFSHPKARGLSPPQPIAGSRRFAWWICTH